MYTQIVIKKQVYMKKVKELFKPLVDFFGRINPKSRPLTHDFLTTVPKLDTIGEENRPVDINEWIAIVGFSKLYKVKDYLSKNHYYQNESLPKPTVYSQDQFKSDVSGTLDGEQTN
jgi:hypothetical protein